MAEAYFVRFLWFTPSLGLRSHGLLLRNPCRSPCSRNMNALSKSIWTHCVAVGAWAEKRGGGWRCNQDGLFLASYTCFQATISRLQIWPQEEMTNDPHGVNSQKQQKDAALACLAHCSKPEKSCQKPWCYRLFSDDWFFVSSFAHKNLKQPD